MASLKDLKTRIGSVKSTQKITKAMKMVAAAKLRRAKEAAEAARPYAEAMERTVGSLAAATSAGNGPALLSGTGKDETHWVVVATSDRGLCGGFNSSIVKAARLKIRELQLAGKQVKLICIGRKGTEQLRTEFGPLIVKKTTLPKKLAYADAEEISSFLSEQYAAGQFDVAHIVYNHFKSAISQVVTFQQIIPLPMLEESEEEQASASVEAPYEYEPEQEEILAQLLPRNLGIQIFKALLENAASEQGARMTAMDNATRNAGEMIKGLNLTYNRTRQAAITKELIEIISGAEAV